MQLEPVTKVTYCSLAAAIPEESATVDELLSAVPVLEEVEATKNEKASQCSHTCAGILRVVSGCVVAHAGSGMSKYSKLTSRERAAPLRT